MHDSLAPLRVNCWSMKEQLRKSYKVSRQEQTQQMFLITFSTTVSFREFACIASTDKGCQNRSNVICYVFGRDRARPQQQLKPFRSRSVSRTVLDGMKPFLTFKRLPPCASHFTVTAPNSRTLSEFNLFICDLHTCSTNCPVKVSHSRFKRRPGIHHSNLSGPQQHRITSLHRCPLKPAILILSPY